MQLWIICFLIWSIRELKIYNARMQSGRAYLSLISEFEPSQSDYRLFLWVVQRQTKHYHVPWATGKDVTTKEVLLKSILY